MKLFYSALAALVFSALVSYSTPAEAKNGVPCPPSVNTQPHQTPSHAVPEPSTILLLGSGLAAVGIARRIRKGA